MHVKQLLHEYIYTRNPECKKINNEKARVCPHFFDLVGEVSEGETAKIVSRKSVNCR